MAVDLDDDIATENHLLHSPQYRQGATASSGVIGGTAGLDCIEQDAARGAELRRLTSPFHRRLRVAHWRGIAADAIPEADQFCPQANLSSGKQFCRGGAKSNSHAVVDERRAAEYGNRVACVTSASRGSLQFRALCVFLSAGATLDGL